MKKRILTAAIALVMSLSLAACSKSATNVVTGYKSGDVKLGQYKGVTYTPASTEVTDEEIESALNQLATSNATNEEVTDRTDVQDGDIVNINYTGYMDGEPFEGGSAEGYDLTIGSSTFIDGFESGLIGHVVGEVVVLELNFPDPYERNTELSGKAVSFDVTINSIKVKVVPEITDEFVAEKTEYTTVADYRQYLAQKLKDEKESDAKSQKEYDVLKKVIENTTFVKDLTSEIEKGKESLISNANSMYQSYYNVDALTVFSALYGMDEAAFNEYMRGQAETNVKFGYIASAIAEEEKVTCTEAEIEELAKTMMDNYGYNSIAELYAALKNVYDSEGKDVVEAQCKLNKAAQIMYDSAVSE